MTGPALMAARYFPPAILRMNANDAAPGIIRKIGVSPTQAVVAQRSEKFRVGTRAVVIAPERDAAPAAVSIVALICGSIGAARADPDVSSIGQGRRESQRRDDSDCECSHEPSPLASRTRLKHRIRYSEALKRPMFSWAACSRATDGAVAATRPDALSRAIRGLYCREQLTRAQPGKQAKDDRVNVCWPDLVRRNPLNTKEFSIVAV